MKLKCLIVDDEPPAHKVIEEYIQRVEVLELSGQCYNAVEAQDFLIDNYIDLIFLDIQMPEVTGFAFLSSLNKPPMVIITSAYTEYALESYEYHVIDYLLKPFRFERFVKAVNRVIDLVNNPKQEAVSSYPPNFSCKVDGKPAEFEYADILYFESSGNYVKIHLDKRYYLTPFTTHEVEKKLPPGQFIRTHKSFIVNMDAITKASDDIIFIKSNQLPVGKTYKKYLRDKGIIK